MKQLCKTTLIAISISLSLSACNLAPKYEQPEISLPSAKFKYDLSNPAIQAASLGWKNYFADPRLQQLIDLAIQNNTDLRIANLNVEQIRAQYAITRANRLPGINATGGANRGGSEHQSIGESYNIGLGISSFELDLWGRVRNTSEAVLQNYLASAAGRDATHLSLIASVAKAHFNEIYANNAMALASRVLKTREETYRLAKLRHNVGVISAIDLRQQEAMIEQAKASYASAIKNKEQARNALEMLISQRLPENLPEPLPLSKQFSVRNLPAGLSSDLLLNRPDIIAAEHNLKAANANIGAARAAFFPRISLTSSIGLGSSELHHLFTSQDSKSWSVSGGLSLPIFNWGANIANLEASKAAQQKTLVAYEAAVESAFRDVSDALVARAAFNSQYESNQAQSKAYAETLRLTRLRYQHGISSSLDLLDAERSSYSADLNTLATELSLAENRADLYKALGGGLTRLSQDEIVIQEQIQNLEEQNIKKINN